MKIAILGYGVEGKSAYTYFSTIYPEAAFSIYDNQTEAGSSLPPRASFAGSITNSSEIAADIVVRSPSVSPHTITSTGRITSVTQEFFQTCPAPIIGVTGTKGKGTTSSLIADILRAAGETVHLVGNIGTPALDELAKITSNDVVVYELSSFQLWDMERSPHTAVVLMIEPDHLDVHTSLKDYIDAKAHITRYQHENDQIIYHPTNPYSFQIAQQSLGQKITYSTEKTAHISQDKIYMNDQEICAVSDVVLPGAHNLENICAAITATWSYTQDVGAIQHAIKNFTGLPHRLKYVAKNHEVAYYDDSISTTPGSAIAALKAFSAPKVIILGGSSKGADFAPLAEELLTSNIRHVLLIGQEATRIQNELDMRGFHQYEVVDGDMNEIVQKAAHYAQAGDVIILSPACASFGMFTSYKDRGQQFTKAVNALDE
jgi:UDP-N-acetylmuramoylalanine--D-glutamate ligase